MYVIYTLWLEKEWVPYLAVNLPDDKKQALEEARKVADAEMAAFPDNPSRIVVVKCTGYPYTLGLETMARLLESGKAVAVI